MKRTCNIGNEANYLGYAYLKEKTEINTGTHQVQVSERVKDTLNENNVKYNDMYLNWNVSGPNVRVSLDNKEYGIFNYQSNKFAVTL